MIIVNNFRKDIAEKVYPYSEYQALVPNVHDLKDPSVFNERFMKLSTGLRLVFQGVADFASRDPRFIEDFLRGFVNPIYTRTFQYADPDAYLAVSYFNENGNPVTFSEPMVSFSLVDFGAIDQVSMFAYVFIDGLHVRLASYQLVNTAYGLRLYIPRSAITADSVVDVVLSRKFNVCSTSAPWRKAYTAAQASVEEIIPVVNLPQSFYNTKYLKPYILKAGNSHYKSVPATDYTFSLDTSGENVRFRYLKPIGVNDVLIFQDLTSYWSKTLTVTPDSVTGAIQSVQLDYLAYGEHVPVPFSDKRDFDIFLDGYHLETDKYTLLTTNTGHSSPKLLFNFHTGQNHGPMELVIHKRESTTAAETLYLLISQLSAKGVEFASGVLPIMPTIGYRFLNQHWVSPSHVASSGKSIFMVNDVASLTNFMYQLNLVGTPVVEEILQRALTGDIDPIQLILLLHGEADVRNAIAADRPAIVVDPNVANIIQYTNGTMIDNSNTTLITMLEFWQSELQAGNNVIIDANVILPEEVSAFTGGDFIIDANIAIGQTIEIATDPAH